MPLVVSAIAALALAVILKMQEKIPEPAQPGLNYRKKGDFLRELEAIVKPFKEHDPGLALRRFPKHRVLVCHNKLVHCLKKKREDLERALLCNPKAKNLCIKGVIGAESLVPTGYHYYSSKKSHVGWEVQGAFIVTDKTLKDLFKEKATVANVLEAQEKYIKECSELMLCPCSKCSEKEEYLLYLHTWGKILHKVHLLVTGSEKFKDYKSWSPQYIAKVLLKIEKKNKGASIQTFQKLNKKILKVYYAALFLLERQAKEDNCLIPWGDLTNAYASLQEVVNYLLSYGGVLKGDLFCCTRSGKRSDPEGELFKKIEICKIATRALLTDDCLPAINGEHSGGKVEVEGFIYTPFIDRPAGSGEIKLWKVLACEVTNN